MVGLGLVEEREEEGDWGLRARRQRGRSSSGFWGKRGSSGYWGWDNGGEHNQRLGELVEVGGGRAAGGLEREIRVGLGF